MIPSTCTRDRRRVCHLLRHLTICNKVLWHAGLQLREDSGDKLGDVVVVRVPGICLGFPYCKTRTHNDKIALSLLRWLLKRHRCIVSVAVNCGAANTSRMVEALESSPTLGRLTLVGDASDQLEAVEKLAHTGDNCPFRQGHTCSPDRMKIAVRLLEKAGDGLVSLDITALKVSVCMAKKLIGALLKNSTITELAVGGCFFASGDLEATSARFVEYLVKEKATLRKLTVKESELVFATAPLNALAQAIRAMTTLEDLAVQGWATRRDRALFLAVVARSLSLRSLTLLLELSNEDFFDQQPIEHVYALCVPIWVTALQENSRLRRLDLDLSWSTSEDCCLLLEGLAKNDTLQCLTLFGLRSGGGLREVCRRIRDCGLDKRVCIESYATDPEDVPTLSSCPEVTSVKVRYFSLGEDVAALLNAFNVIATCCHITSLSVSIDFFTHDAFTSLAACITEASSLKAFQLVDEFPYYHNERYEMHEEAGPLRHSISNVFEALSSNKSITRISLDTIIALRDEDCQALADAALNNLQLSELIFTALRDISVGVFLRRLLPRLAENYNILLLEIPACVMPNFEMCAAQDVVRRNCGLVKRATRFVMGDHRPECGRPFELLSEQPVLVENVLLEDTMTNKDDAVDRIKRALQVVRRADLHMYMRLTGVVKECVECEVQADGSTQLDQLNLYCCLHLIRYLKLADVVEP